MIKQSIVMDKLHPRGEQSLVAGQSSSNFKRLLPQYPPSLPWIILPGTIEYYTLQWFQPLSSGSQNSLRWFRRIYYYIISMIYRLKFHTLFYISSKVYVVTLSNIKKFCGETESCNETHKQINTSYQQHSSNTQSPQTCPLLFLHSLGENKIQR